jgi:putative oxidoreductase
MKIVVTIARILLGLLFVVFGANGIHQFIPNPNGLPPGLAGQFAGAMFASHYFYLVGGVQLIGGLLVLVNRYTVLGLTLLGPILVNILAFHTLMDPKGIVPGLVCTVLWFVLFFRYRQYFSGLFVQKPE